MMWTINRKEHQAGEIRYIKRFAWLPIRAGAEVRWLEKVYIEQRLWESWHEIGWENIRFLTKEQYMSAIIMIEAKEVAQQLKPENAFIICAREDCRSYKNGACGAFNPIMHNGCCLQYHKKEDSNGN